MWKRGWIAGLTSAALLSAAPAFAGEVDENLPDYERVSGISGNLGSQGSDTLNNLMTLWAEEFQDFYPNVSVEIEGAGSGTAPVALAEGTANFGPMSRDMRSSEIEDFEDAHGYEPTKVRVAIDTIAVFVNRDNPIDGLTMEQVDGMFSETQRCGGDDITRWGDVGLDGAWSNRDIILYSRNAVSGTYGFFRENALCDGDFKDAINEQPGSASVVQGVSESLNGIGYSGIGYKTSGVKAIALGDDEDNLYEPNAENAVSGDYPLSRFLYVYVNKDPNGELPPIEREFLRLVLSKEGQEVVRRDGFIPMPAEAAEREKERLGL
ncbi:PstS family phosphate ABC transporter substrate-binding protein [Halorhodospira halophila]|uniref:Phosphate-binding protein n=1 Tax=Halorhodospira halophila (strain DSM 244 / SL1) TaxID=349124 RepID=A1WT79_HALHL|nr:phosphate ABC transporter substrate-binding protein PstS family protein [Halorhodospira halophila]ABM60891.1 phosphate ABC transporter substrate-binding protein, PhoT family [Halorhodospira halophila SL1]